MRKTKAGVIVTDFACYFIGAALYAVAICCFVKPNGLVTGGFAGLGIILNHLTHFPIGVSVFLLNIPLFLLGYQKVGKGFIFRSAAATAAAAVMIDLAEQFLPKVPLDPILAALAGGVLEGCGLALIFLRGGSTGGADIIGKLVNVKYPHLGIGRVMMAVDFVVITLFAILFGGITAALYSAVMIAVSSAAVDYFLYGAKSGKVLLAVTKKGELLAETVNALGRRGATIVPVIGAYTKNNISMVMIAVRSHEIGKIYRIIFQNDPDAFITLLDARQITGQGFETHE